MKNDKVKKWLYLILIFGGFFILATSFPVDWIRPAGTASWFCLLQFCCG